MSEIATLSPSNILDKIAKFFRVMAREGVDLKHYQLPIDDKTARRNLAEYLNLGCPEIKDGQIVVAPYNNYAFTRTILGKDFIEPKEIAQARKLVYSDALLRYFAETLPSEEVLQWLHENGFTLIAGPPNPMSFLEICELKNQLFCSEPGNYYANFSREDKVHPEWLMLRKGIVPKSTGKTLYEQEKLLTEVEYVPNASETMWGETTYKEVRNAWLFSNIYARTSSVDSASFRIRVGDLAGGGVCVDDDWVGRCDDFLGLASARKRNLNP
jgi:hypothetical protein